MINEKELRIGNYIIYHSGGGEGDMPCKIDGTDIGLFENKEGYAEMHSPMPLTEEILESAGLLKEEKRDPFGGYLIQLWDGYSLRLIKEEGKWTWDYYGSKIEVTALHQLQNLFFIFTKNELKINLTQKV